MTHVDELEVIAYSSVSGQMVPTTVSPIFRVKNTDSVLYPEKIDEEGYVVGWFDPYERFLEHSKRGCYTLIIPVFQAKKNHILWIDQKMNPCYEEIEIAEKHLKDIYEMNIGIAFEAIESGEYERAIYHSGLALCSDDRRAESKAIKYFCNGELGQRNSIWPRLCTDDKELNEFWKVVNQLKEQ